jgi:mono/diheme cytochrome c family protein/uncharacterized membrane protein
VVAGCVVLISLAGCPFSASTSIHAQTDSSRSRQRPATELPAASAAKTETPAVRELFGEHCTKCHGADGTGKAQRDRLPEIPDFTSADWQTKRVDARLTASILEGKGEGMPPWRGKISEAQARDLVAHVRSFAKGAGWSEHGRPKSQALTRFQEHFDRLTKQLDKLDKQYREVSEDAADSAHTKASDSGQVAAARKSAAAAPETSAVRELFENRCAKCHGADGTGKKARDRLPALPDFTTTSWQGGRTDSRLMASILDGKGEEMPSWRGKITKAQARRLVAYVRAFARAMQGEGPGDKEREASAGPGESKPPRGRLGKLIRWLGKSHPATVHFPIALLTAATVSELLRIVTNRPTLDAVTRYCVWFGAVTAALAGSLGWFLAGFHLTDGSWVLTTHRWLGTSTVASAGVVLALCEASQYPARHRTRICFRVMLFAEALLVSVTGFFGGSVVYGLDHYAWPE